MEATPPTPRWFSPLFSSQCSSVDARRPTCNTRAESTFDFTDLHPAGRSTFLSTVGARRLPLRPPRAAAASHRAAAAMGRRVPREIDLESGSRSADSEAVQEAVNPRCCWVSSRYPPCSGPPTLQCTGHTPPTPTARHDSLARTDTPSRPDGRPALGAHLCAQPRRVRCGRCAAGPGARLGAAPDALVAVGGGRARRHGRAAGNRGGAACPRRPQGADHLYRRLRYRLRPSPRADFRRGLLCRLPLRSAPARDRVQRGLPAAAAAHACRAAPRPGLRLCRGCRAGLVPRAALGPAP